MTKYIEPSDEASNVNNDICWNTIGYYYWDLFILNSGAYQKQPAMYVRPISWVICKYGFLEGGDRQNQIVVCSIYGN